MARTSSVKSYTGGLAPMDGNDTGMAVYPWSDSEALRGSYIIGGCETPGIQMNIGLDILFSLATGKAWNTRVLHISRD
jgi:hypothetical protein